MCVLPSVRGVVAGDVSHAVASGRRAVDGLAVVPDLGGRQRALQQLRRTHPTKDRTNFSAQKLRGSVDG